MNRQSSLISFYVSALRCVDVILAIRLCKCACLSHDRPQLSRKRRTFKSLANHVVNILWREGNERTFFRRLGLKGFCRFLIGSVVVRSSNGKKMGNLISLFFEFFFLIIFRWGNTEGVGDLFGGLWWYRTWTKNKLMKPLLSIDRTSISY